MKTSLLKRSAWIPTTHCLHRFPQCLRSWTRWWAGRDARLFSWSSALLKSHQTPWAPRSDLWWIPWTPWCGLWFRYGDSGCSQVLSVLPVPSEALKQHGCNSSLIKSGWWAPAEAPLPICGAFPPRVDCFPQGVFRCYAPSIPENHPALSRIR